MLNVQSRRTLRLVVLWLFLAVAVGAQTHPPKLQLSDPEGKAYARRLLDLYRAGLEDPAFSDLSASVKVHPHLTKRAFLYLLFDRAHIPPNDESGRDELALEILGLLAQKLAVDFGDETPRLIMSHYASGGEPMPGLLASYALSQWPGYMRDRQFVHTSTPALVQTMGYGKPMGPVDLKAWAFLKPIFVSVLRVSLAELAVDPRLLIQEIDSFPSVLDGMRQELFRIGATPEGAEVVMREVLSDKILYLLSEIRITTLTQFGLFEESETLARQVLANNTGGKFSNRMTAYRVAYRTNRPKLARQYLDKARGSSSLAAEYQPVVEYSLRTADYQLRRLTGLDPSPAQVVQEFEKAWAALDNYQPLVNVAKDEGWKDGRLASRYWLDELARYPRESGPSVALMATRLGSWRQSLVGFKQFQSYKPDDYLLRVMEVVGYTGFELALYDQLIYLAETFPQETSKTGLSLTDLVNALGSLVTDMEGRPEKMGLLGTVPALPQYDLTGSSLIVELQARAAFIAARDPAAKVEARAAGFRESARIIRGAGDPEVVQDYLLKAGRGLRDLGLGKEAVELWEESLRSCRKLGYELRALEASRLLAEEYARQSDWAKAATFADQGVDQITGIAQDSGSTTFRGVDIQEQAQNLTELSVAAHAKADNPAAAMAALERGKDVANVRWSVQSNSNAQVAFGALQQQKHEAVVLQAQVEELSSMASSATRDQILESNQQLLADNRAQYLVKSRELRQQHSGLYSKSLKFDPLDLPSVQKSLPADLAVVQYFITDETLYIFSLTSDALRLRSLPVSREELDGHVLSYCRTLRRKSDVSGLVSDSQWLSRALLAPVSKELTGKSTLIFLPSERLNLLPFAALAGEDGVSLVERFRILQLAKASSLINAAAGEPTVVNQVVAFTNATEDLPKATEEGAELSKLFPGSQVFNGKQATKKNLLEHGSAGQVLHFATHGEWNLDNSLKNYLVMAGGEKVSQEEIFQLDLGEMSMVILSACNTAMGDGLDTKFVASLAEAFWLAGSRSVVASLWAVDDASTSLLMKEFYQAIKAGDGKAEALRKAQLAVRGHAAYQHPYFWSGFVLYGEWN